MKGGRAFKGMEKPILSMLGVHGPAGQSRNPVKDAEGQRPKAHRAGREVGIVQIRGTADTALPVAIVVVFAFLG